MGWGPLGATWLHKLNQFSCLNAAGDVDRPLSNARHRSDGQWSKSCWSRSRRFVTGGRCSAQFVFSCWCCSYSCSFLLYIYTHMYTGHTHIYIIWYIYIYSYHYSVWSCIPHMHLHLYIFVCCCFPFANRAEQLGLWAGKKGPASTSREPVKIQDSVFGLWGATVLPRHGFVTQGVRDLMIIKFGT